MKFKVGDTLFYKYPYYSHGDSSKRTIVGIKLGQYIVIDPESDKKPFNLTVSYVDLDYRLATPLELALL